MTDSILPSPGSSSSAPSDAAVSHRPEPSAFASGNPVGRSATADLLRGLAALAVLAFHANATFWRSSPEFGPWRQAAGVLVGHGFLGVTLFFVISGFCIHLPNVGATTLNLRAFAVRRFWRLYPVYLVVVVSVFAMAIVMDAHFHRARSTGEYAWDFVGHLFFWHYWGNPPYLGVTPVLWSIAIEVEFYVLYALVYPLLRRVGVARMALVMLGLGLAYRIVYYALGAQPAGAWTVFEPRLFAPVRFGEWLLGAWVAEAYARGRLGSRSAARGMLVAGAALILGSAVTAPAWGRVGLDVMEFGAAIGFALIFAALASREVRAAGATAAPPADTGDRRPWSNWAADRSYSLYLTHYTALSVAGNLWAAVARIPDREAAAGTLVWLPSVAIGIVLALVVAEVCFRLVERPSHRLARALARRVAERQSGVPAAA